MRRIVSYILVAWFVLLGTGVVQYVHESQHKSAVCITACADRIHHEENSRPARDDNGCTLCLQLESLTLLNQTILVSLPAMQMVETRSTVVSLPVVNLLPRRLDCRGPPAC